jgi:hypothetical protein
LLVVFLASAGALAAGSPPEGIDKTKEPPAAQSATPAAADAETAGTIETLPCPTASPRGTCIYSREARIGKWGRSIDLTGICLGIFDTTIDPADTRSIAREVLRLATALEEQIGPIDDFTVGSVRVYPEDITHLSSAIQIFADQELFGHKVGGISLHYEGQCVTHMWTNIVDPYQPNARTGHWMREDDIAARAKECALLATKESDIDESQFKKREMNLYVEGPEFALSPEYVFEYRNWRFFVNGLNLETTFTTVRPLPSSPRVCPR